MNFKFILWEGHRQSKSLCSLWNAGNKHMKYTVICVSHVCRYNVIFAMPWREYRTRLWVGSSRRSVCFYLVLNVLWRSVQWRTHPSCSALNEESPCRLTCLNSWSLTHNAVSDSYRTFPRRGLAGEVCNVSWLWGFMASPHFLFIFCFLYMHHEVISQLLAMLSFLPLCTSNPLKP